MATDRVELARLYVERSNGGEIDAALAMFDAAATYRSSQVGAFEGRDAIGAMMRGFFGRFPDASWEVDEYRPGPDASVEFDFVMRGTNAETGEAVERSGRERLFFTAAGAIRHVEVEAS